MKSLLIVFVFFAITKARQFQPEYLRKCTTKMDFAVLCKTYLFNDCDCFPWNIVNCTYTKAEEHVMCVHYDCSVRSKVFFYQHLCQIVSF
jgi:hypothetical protein